MTGAVLFFILPLCRGQDDSAGQLAGSWVRVVDNTTIFLNFTSEEKVEVEFTGDEVVDVYASYVTAGKRITFQDEAGEYSSGTSGVYEFSLGENSVTFTKVDDPVDGRSMLLAGTWSRTDN